MATADHGEDLENDVCFILTSAFLIFTMQTGYGLLESGTVSRKNEVNILLKNAVNIICGALAFWCYGFAFSSREDDVNWLKISELNVVDSWIKPGSKITWRSKDSSAKANNSFFTTNLVTPNRFFMHLTSPDWLIGTTYAEMAFQLAYATSCTAIISGAMAERCRFVSYFVFSLMSNVLFCLPARWIMFNGWLKKAGAIDIGGSGTVHLVGGCAGLVAAILLGPRLGRFEGNFTRIPMGNPTNAVHGIILLWWGWLGYSAGSSFGITGDKWKYSSRSSVATIMASMAGGAYGMVWSTLTEHGLQDIKILSYSILSSLVAISGGAPIMRPIYSIITGIIAAGLTLVAIPLLEKLQIDDPTDSFSVHAVAGAWGLIATGLFSDLESVVHYREGFHNLTQTKAEGSNLRSSLLLAQLYALAVLTVWSLVTTLLLLLPIQFTIGIRLSTQEEILGADYVEHGIVHEGNKMLLSFIKQKIGLVSSGAMSEAQASAEVAKRWRQHERIQERRKLSITGHRPSTSSDTHPPLVPEELVDIWPKFRYNFQVERQLQPGRYYHNHERKAVSLRSILDATHGSVINNTPHLNATSATSNSIWNVIDGYQQVVRRQPATPSLRRMPATFQQQFGPMYQRRQAAMESRPKTRNSYGSNPSPPLTLPTIED